jgi:membrane-associated phospholipid phosphatase
VRNSAGHSYALSPWTAEIGLRMRKLFWLKFIGTTAVTCLFFIGYFHVLRNPVHPVVVMPLTALDHWIDFRPEALYVYLTLWLYIGFGPGLQRSLLELNVYGLWLGAMCVTGLALFYLWPTAVPPLGFDASGFPGFALLQGVDAAGNACPSLHVATAMFTMIRVEHLLREAGTPRILRLLNLLWFVAIAWSTLAVKQHVALDALAGALLGVAFALPSLRWRPAPQRLSSNATRISEKTP